MAVLLLIRTVAGSPALERPRRPEAPGGFGRAGALPSGWRARRSEHEAPQARGALLPFSGGGGSVAVPVAAPLRLRIR